MQVEVEIECSQHDAGHGDGLRGEVQAGAALQSALEQSHRAAVQSLHWPRHCLCRHSPPHALRCCSQGWRQRRQLSQAAKKAAKIGGGLRQREVVVGREQDLTLQVEEANSTLPLRLRLAVCCGCCSLLAASETLSCRVALLVQLDAAVQAAERRRLLLCRVLILLLCCSIAVLLLLAAVHGGCRCCVSRLQLQLHPASHHLQQLARRVLHLAGDEQRRDRHIRCAVRREGNTEEREVIQSCSGGQDAEGEAEMRGERGQEAEREVMPGADDGQWQAGQQ